MKKATILSTSTSVLIGVLTVGLLLAAAPLVGVQIPENSVLIPMAAGTTSLIGLVITELAAHAPPRDERQG